MFTLCPHDTEQRRQRSDAPASEPDSDCGARLHRGHGRGDLRPRPPLRVPAARAPRGPRDVGGDGRLACRLPRLRALSQKRPAGRFHALLLPQPARVLEPPLRGHPGDRGERHRPVRHLGEAVRSAARRPDLRGGLGCAAAPSPAEQDLHGRRCALAAGRTRDGGDRRRAAGLETSDRGRADPDAGGFGAAAARGEREPARCAARRDGPLLLRRDRLRPPRASDSATSCCSGSPSEPSSERSRA